MSEETLERAYRLAYHRHNEFQLIQCDFDSLAIRAEIAKWSRRMERIIDTLGYVPST